MSLPDENKASKALEYLATTDEAYARQSAHVKGLEHHGKTIKAVEFLKATGTMAEKEAKALSSSAYIAWQEDMENAVADLETMKAKRKRGELVIEVWRSLNANRRQGA